MILKLENKNKFKKDNIGSWAINSDLWLKLNYIHLGLKEFLTAKIIYDLNEQKKKILDVGCGSGWLLKEIKKLNNNFNYTGIDNCDVFVSHLTSQYKNETNINFFNIDFENFITSSVIETLKSDIIVCSLSLIEMPFIEIAFENISKVLNKGGKIYIISLNPLIELFRSCENENKFGGLLELYRKSDTPLFLSKKILVNGFESEREYFRILYSLQTYISLAKKFNLNINDISEINFNTKLKEPVYQFLSLKKSS